MYTIEELALMTGMTDRTIRNYLKQGFLVGEKENGKWNFTEQQLGDFLEHPAVKPALKAKRNSVVFDFLANSKKQKEECCVILDCQKSNWAELSNFFCNAVNERTNIKMNLYNENGNVRVIVSGDTDSVLDVIAEYRAM